VDCCLPPILITYGNAPRSSFTQRISYVRCRHPAAFHQIANTRCPCVRGLLTYDEAIDALDTGS
jgi:hypothetical protein